MMMYIREELQCGDIFLSKTVGFVIGTDRQLTSGTFQCHAGRLLKLTAVANVKLGLMQCIAVCYRKFPATC